MQQRLIGSVSKIRSVYKIYATCNVPLRDNDLNLSTTHQAVHVYTWMHQLISDNLFLSYNKRKYTSSDDTNKTWYRTAIVLSAITKFSILTYFECNIQFLVTLFLLS